MSPDRKPHEEPKWDGTDRRNEPPRAPWKLERRISTGDLLVLCGALSGFLVFSWGIASSFKDALALQDKRLTVIEEKQAMQANVDSRQDVQLRDAMRDIKSDLGDIRRIMLERPR